MIELVIFIVIIGVAMAGFVALFATTSRSSADPMVRKQMLAVAESLMEEVVMQPFTFCDPDDPSATTALVPAFSGTAGCSTAAFVQTGPMTGETRTDAVTPFDNVVDYSGLAPITPITDLAGNTNANLAGYDANIAIVAEGLGGIASDDSSAANLNVLRIVVSVGNATNNDRVVLESYRTRYAPNFVP